MTRPGSVAALSPQEESAAHALFGERLAGAVRFAGHLAVSGVERGLIGPRELPRLWERHLLNCAAIVELIPQGAVVVDVGSGAGLPGVVIALARPDLEVTLIEPLLRRVTWLAEVLADLGLSAVRVERARAEELAGVLVTDVAVARALAPIGRLATWCAPLVRRDGVVLALKGRSVTEELSRDAAELTTAGVTAWSLHSCGVGLLAEPTTVARLEIGGGSSMRPRLRSR